MNRLSALLAAVALTCLSVPAHAQGVDSPSGHRNLTQQNGVCADGVSSVVVSTSVAGTVGIDVSNTWTGTLDVFLKTGAGGYVLSAIATPVGGGTAVSAITSNGSWTVPVAGGQDLCVAFSNSTVTGTATVWLNASPAAPPSSGGTASQGSANTSANAWPVKLTDGTSVTAVKAASTPAAAGDPSAVVALSPNSPIPVGSNAIGSVAQGAANTAANAWPTEITDGTNTATVKAASTAAVAADKAVVVSVSPNNLVSVETFAAPSNTGSLAVTCANSATTTNGTAVTGFGKCKAVSFYALLHGSSGGTTDVYIQSFNTTLNGYIDRVHFTQMASNSTTFAWVAALSQMTSAAVPVQINNASGTTFLNGLAAAAVVNGPWGGTLGTSDQFRLSCVTGTSTSAGNAQTIYFDCAP